MCPEYTQMDRPMLPSALSKVANHGHKVILWLKVMSELQQIPKPASHHAYPCVYCCMNGIDWFSQIWLLEWSVNFLHCGLLIIYQWVLQLDASSLEYRNVEAHHMALSWVFIKTSWPLQPFIISLSKYISQGARPSVKHMPILGHL